MATKAQIHANQLNAQKSTGPSTPDGKAVVSKNALKHGLSAHQHVISAEDQADFDLHRDKMLVELNPIGPMESILADRVICLSWRLKRAVSIQNQAFDVMLEPAPPNPLAKLALKLTGQSQTEPDPDPSLALGRAVVKDLSGARVIERLLMYERRIEHSLFKTIAELQRLNLTREFNPAVNPLRNIFRHSQSPRYEESPAPKPDMSPSVCSRPSDYLAPSFTGGHKTENPAQQCQPTSPGSRDTILQNKPNLGKVQMNPNPCLKMTYEEKCSPDDPKNKPNSNPIFDPGRHPIAAPESRATSHGARPKAKDGHEMGRGFRYR